MKSFRKFLWLDVWTLSLIGILMVLRHIGIMAGYGRYLISPRFPFDSLNQISALQWLNSGYHFNNNFYLIC